MDIKLTIPDAQAPRVARVIGLQLGLMGVGTDGKPDGKQRSATLAEVKGWLADKLRDVVRSYETNETVEQAKVNLADLTVS